MSSSSSSSTDNRPPFPFLLDVDQFLSYKIAFKAYLGACGLSRILRANYVAPAVPAANATPAARLLYDTHVIDEGKVYGLGVTTLTKLPHLLQRVLDKPAVKAAEDYGSVLFKELEKEIMDNPNRSIYTAIQTRIDMFQQGKLDLPNALSTMDQMWASLPQPLRPTDATKIIHLRRSLAPAYKDLVKSISVANQNITYAAICEILISEHRTSLAVAHGDFTVESDAAHIAVAASGPEPAEQAYFASSSVSSSSSSTASTNRSPDRGDWRGRGDRRGYTSWQRGRSPSIDRNTQWNSGRSPSRDRGGAWRRDRSNSRDRSRSRDRADMGQRHPAAGFRGGGRAASPHRNVRFSPSPARGILKSSGGSSSGSSRPGITCHGCGGVGHVKAVCPTKNV
jgi:hypothetical protein